MNDGEENNDVNCTTLQGEPPDDNDTTESGEGNQTIIRQETGSSWVWQYIWLLKNGPMKTLAQDIVFISLQALHQCRQEEIHRLPDFPAQWWSSQWQ